MVKSQSPIVVQGLAQPGSSCQVPDYSSDITRYTSTSLDISLAIFVGVKRGAWQPYRGLGEEHPTFGYFSRRRES